MEHRPLRQLAAFGLLLWAAAAGAEQPGGAGTATADDAISTSVKARLLADRGITRAHIRITTTNGTVALAGTVPDSRSAASAAADARSVEGVKGVDTSALTISAQSPTQVQHGG